MKKLLKRIATSNYDIWIEQHHFLYPDGEPAPNGYGYSIKVASIEIAAASGYLDRIDSRKSYLFTTPQMAEDYAIEAAKHIFGELAIAR